MYKQSSEDKKSGKVFSRAVEIYKSEGILTLANKCLEKIVDSLDSTPLPFYLSVKKLSSRMEKERGLTDVLDTVFQLKGYGTYKTISPIQVRKEIEELAQTVRKINPSTVMEIGTASGGTLYIWARYLKPDKIISLDLPKGEFGGGYPEKKIKLFRCFSDKETLVIG